jgi:hypothetical protein
VTCAASAIPLSVTFFPSNSASAFFALMVVEDSVDAVDGVSRGFVRTHTRVQQNEGLSSNKFSH